MEGASTNQGKLCKSTFRHVPWKCTLFLARYLYLHASLATALEIASRISSLKSGSAPLCSSDPEIRDADSGSGNNSDFASHKRAQRMFQDPTRDQQAE